MANSSPQKQFIDGSSIVDMEVIEGDESDYESSITGDMKQQDDDTYGRKRAPDQSDNTMDDMQKKVTRNVASYVWQSGSQQAKSVLNTYANVDLLRPYFNVEPHEVRQRLLLSLVPQKPGSQQMKVPRELYGPTMLIFTLIALLLFQMKTGGHTVQEGTLMGTAFGTCFGYWLGVSSFIWFLAYVCNTHVTMLQILSLIGYALFGHCIVLGVTTVIHTSHDHMFFYLMWAVVGGLSTLKLVSVFVSRTAGQTQRLIVCGSVAFLHLCFLLYLHFAYHQMVEELSDMIQQGGPPAPGIAHNTEHRIVERAAVPIKGNTISIDPPKVAGVPALRVGTHNAPSLGAQIGNQAVNQPETKHMEAAKPVEGQKAPEVVKQIEETKPLVNQGGTGNKLLESKNDPPMLKSENKPQGVILEAIKKDDKV